METIQMREQETAQVGSYDAREERSYVAHEELQMAAQAYFDTRPGLPYGARVQMVIEAVLAQLIM